MDTRDVSRPPSAPDLAVLELGGGVGEGAARGLVFLSAATEARAPAAAAAEVPDPDPAVHRLSFPLNSGPGSPSLSLSLSLSGISFFSTGGAATGWRRPEVRRRGKGGRGPAGCWWWRAGGWQDSSGSMGGGLEVGATTAAGGVAVADTDFF